MHATFYLNIFLCHIRSIMSGKSESHKALDELGNKILSNARNELFLSMRFLSGALFKPSIQK